MKAPALLIVLLFAAGVAGCDDNTVATTPTTPTTTSPTTATWWGILPVPGSVTRSFVATKAGTVTVTLTTITGRPIPPTIGIGIPQTGEAGCTLTQTAPAVSQTDPIFNVNVDAGTFCLKLVDTTPQPGSVEFSATLVHP